MPDEATDVGVLSMEAIAQQAFAQASQGATPTLTIAVADPSADSPVKDPSENDLAKQEFDQSTQGATPTTFDY